MNLTIPFIFVLCMTTVKPVITLYCYVFNRVTSLARLPYWFTTINASLCHIAVFINLRIVGESNTLCVKRQTGYRKLANMNAIECTIGLCEKVKRTLQLQVEKWDIPSQPTLTVSAVTLHTGGNTIEHTR